MMDIKEAEYEIYNYMNWVSHDGESDVTAECIAPVLERIGNHVGELHTHMDYDSMKGWSIMIMPNNMKTQHTSAITLTEAQVMTIAKVIALIRKEQGNGTV